MKVVSKQRNSKMCIICGLNNEYGLRAPFYNMEDGSVMSVFRYRDGHQSYPGRVHGGLIGAMLDELGLRALWTNKDEEEIFGVTLTLETKYRKPVPYDADLVGKAVLVHNTPKFFTAEASIADTSGALLANGTLRYIKLPVQKIAQGIDAHEEMCYLIEDGVKEI